MTAGGSTPSFRDHVALLSHFLAHRSAIVDRIDATLLNVQGKDTSQRRDYAHFERLLDSCFFGLAGMPREWLRLKGQLAAAHLADGFEPVPLDNFSQELDPLQLVARAYHHWGAHRWPGKSGRLTFAENIFAVFMLRQLESLTLRIWDDGPSFANAHLEELQTLTDRLNDRTTAVVVRDVRWLVQTAQGPLTRYLAPYFRVAEQIAATFDNAFGIGLHDAGARLGGGHLRSQLRYRTWESDKPIDDPVVLAITRNSNSMDGALLMWDLVPLLRAYASACAAGRIDDRLRLADAILQGLSADPELFVLRLDLVGPCTMIEDLFISTDGDHVTYTPMGHSHVSRLNEYRSLLGELVGSLRTDARELDPAGRAYSPFGIAYGFCADVFANMAMDSLVGHAPTPLGFEDIFAGRGQLDTMLKRAQGWELLPIRPGERPHFYHSAEWSAQMFGRLVDALDARARHGTDLNATNLPSGRLLLAPEGTTAASLPGQVVDADEHCFTTDMPRALATTLTGTTMKNFLSDRNEARYLASVHESGHWFGVSKIILSLVTSQGHDALITGLSPRTVEILRLTCPGLVESV